MTINQAVKKALQGGWRPHHEALFMVVPYGVDQVPWGIQVGDAFTIDPSFWQCFGKALGWPEGVGDYYFHGNDIRFENSWHFYWHLYIDDLANGRTAEQFFGRFS